MSVKISYKNGDDQRSVVILKNGSAMEVRRGQKTKWISGEERGSWPSMTAWAATLPAEWDPVSSWKLVKGAPVCGGHGFPLSPLLATFMESARATVTEIDTALFSYIAYHFLRSQNWIDKRFQTRLDDYLVVLTGLHPGTTHEDGSLLKAVLKRHITEPKSDIPSVELESADTQAIVSLWGQEALFSAAPAVKEEAPVLVVDELPGTATILPSPEVPMGLPVTAELPVPMGLPVIAGIPMGSPEAEAEAAVEAEAAAAAAAVPAPEPKTELQRVQEVLASVLERLSIPEPRHVKFAIGFLTLYDANNWV